MMQITRETDYAMRCVLYLTKQNSGIVMVDAIAREMATPKSFLAKILQKLTRAGIVRSFRGVKGGFQLNRKPSEITLLDVIEAVEGTVTLNACTVDSSICSFSGTCGVHKVWVKIRADVVSMLKEHNFADIAASTENGQQA